MRKQSGFTLIELMVVVAILGVLAAAAIPSFVKYIRRSKTSEAVMNIRKLYDGSVAYYVRDPGVRNGSIIPHQFPASAATTPLAGTCCASPGRKCAPNPALWQDPTWAALGFAVDDPFYYSYQYVASGSDATSQFTARVMGDLDCDNRFSTYERTGRIDSQRNVTGGAGLYVVNDIE